MPEELQTRTEHSRSLEDADKYRALQTLTELGLLIPLSEIESFHGRLGTAEEVEEWAVDPSFANGSNDSGNDNVNSRPTLYTGEEEVAKDFAKERSEEIIWPKYRKIYEDRVRNYTPRERKKWLKRINKEEKDWWKSLSEEERQRNWRNTTGKLRVYKSDDLDSRSAIRNEATALKNRTPKNEQDGLLESVAKKFRAEVHEITSGDTDARVLDFSFDESKLDEEGQEKYKKALRALVIPMTEGSPVSFEDRGTTRPFVEAVSKQEKHMLLKSEVAALAAEAGISEEVAIQLAGAYNAHRIVQIRPSYLVSKLIYSSEDIIFDSLKVEGKPEELPINLEYVQRLLRQAHIVGVKQIISSATLGRDITSVSFFDLEKTITAKGLEVERRATWQKLGEMTTALDNSVGAEKQLDQPLLRLLAEDVYAKPEKLMAAAKLVDGYDEIFNADAGNWEGFTLAEHTETVLRNFDESYAENLPVELLAPMRLAILAHDVGKPIAAAQGEKHRQKEYNVAQADDFLGKLGIDERLKGLLLAVIGDGEELAFQIYVRGAGEPAQAAMKELATTTLSQFYGSERVTDEQVVSFIEMCKMLQVCDGGAYTSMAITNKGAGKGRHRNAPSFNASFAQPVGFGKRTIRLRKEGDKAAAHDLTPKGRDTVSKLKISHSGAGHRAPQL